jgi:hypothetical protein
VTGYGLDGWVLFPAEARLFSSPRHPERCPEIHPASYRMGMRGALFVGVKRTGREADHSPLSSAKVKNAGAIPPFPVMSLWRGA